MMNQLLRSILESAESPSVKHKRKICQMKSGIYPFIHFFTVKLQKSFIKEFNLGPFNQKQYQENLTLKRSIILPSFCKYSFVLAHAKPTLEMRRDDHACVEISGIAQAPNTEMRHSLLVCRIEPSLFWTI